MFSVILPTLIWCGSYWSAIKVREEIVQRSGKAESANKVEALEIARSETFYSYIHHMIRTFGGGALANLYLGMSPLAAFLVPSHFLMATCAWWTVFFFPGDYVYQFYTTNTVVYKYLEVANEIWRASKIESGVQSALQTHYLEDEVLRVVNIAVAATINANGGEIFSMIRGAILDQHVTEISPTMKMSFVSAVLMSVPFMLDIGIDHNLVLTFAITLFIIVQATSVIGGFKFEGLANISYIGGLAIALIICCIQILNIYTNLLSTQAA